MFPFSVNIQEARYFRPMHKALVDLPPFSAWISMDRVDNAIDNMMRMREGGTLLSTDFSAYDQTLVKQQAWYFDYLKLFFRAQVQDDILLLEHNFKNVPIICTEDVSFAGAHGVPSGSVFTNQCDSIVNLLGQASSPVVDNTLIQVQGDDAVVVVKDVKRHVEHLQGLGFDLNVDKQLASYSSVSYLQRLYDDSYKPDGIARGVYPTLRALNSLLGQERFYDDWDSTMVSLRVLAILENTKWHPLFDAFVKFVVEDGDPLLKDNVVKLCDSRSRESRKVFARAKAIPGLVPTFNQSGEALTVKGLSAFSSVQLILSL
jgi:hypothetical protein